MFFKRHPFFLVALIVVPLLSMTTTTPIFLVLDNSLEVLPVIWLLGCVPLTVSWLLNYHIYEKVKGKIWLQWLITTSIMTIITAGIRFLFEGNLIAFLEGVNGAPVRRVPPLLTTVGVVKMNNTLIVAFQTLVRYRLKEVQLVKELGETKLLRVQAQYENLKNQIHPHFLFNTLNILKILVHKDPVKAEEYIIKVSDFLRVSIQSSQTAIQTVEEDLRIASNYLEIQEVRFKDTFYLNSVLPDDILKKNIPILTFQCLFENALKHNKLSKQRPLEIRIEALDDETILVTNTLVPLDGERMESTGTGLANLRERFVLLGAESPEIIETEHSFGMKLKLLS
jgi:sensor histidine kinase YesM